MKLSINRSGYLFIGQLYINRHKKKESYYPLMFFLKIIIINIIITEHSHVTPGLPMLQDLVEINICTIYLYTSY